MEDHKYGITITGVGVRLISWISHSGTINKVDKISPAMNQSYRIYSEDSISATNLTPFPRLGPNFISFQNWTHRLINILSFPSFLGRTNL